MASSVMFLQYSTFLPGNFSSFPPHNLHILIQILTAHVNLHKLWISVDEMQVKQR